MFEIFNEPILQNWTETIKPYHEEVVEADTVSFAHPLDSAV